MYKKINDNIEKILSKFSQIKIAVIGDLMIDEYIKGTVDRISPEAPVQIVNVTSESYVLGGAANVVNNIVSLGGACYVGGVIGNDYNGNRVKHRLKSDRIFLDSLITDETRPTIMKKRILAQHQQLLRLDWESRKKINVLLQEKIYENLVKNIDNIDAFILSDYDKGTLTEELSQKIINLANKNFKIVVVDPKPENKKYYKNATSMTPNLKEAKKLGNVQYVDSESEIFDLGIKIKDELNLTNLVITRSEKGMSIFTKKDIVNIKTYAKDVFDVTGAGDTVISVYTMSLVGGATYSEAAHIANIAAGIVVGRVGTATVTTQEILEYHNQELEKLNV